MATVPVRVGDRLGDDVVVYRAFSTDGFRDRKANRVRPRAYYRRQDHADGLSVGLTPRDSVSELAVNFGYCSLQVGPVHRLPYDVQIRRHLDDEGHALICNLPFIDGTDGEREQATLIAGALARLSIAVTCDFYRPNGQDNLPPA